MLPAPVPPCGLLYNLDVLRYEHILILIYFHSVPPLFLVFIGFVSLLGLRGFACLIVVNCQLLTYCSFLLCAVSPDTYPCKGQRRSLASGDTILLSQGMSLVSSPLD